MNKYPNLSQDQALQRALNNLNSKVYLYEEDLPENIYGSEQYKDCYIFRVSKPDKPLMIDGNIEYIAINMFTGDIINFSHTAGG